jgi:hypothetical protein
MLLLVLALVAVGLGSKYDDNIQEDVSEGPKKKEKKKKKNNLILFFPFQLRAASTSLWTK